MKKAFLTFFLGLACLLAHPQKVKLTFTAHDAIGQYAKLDSVVITNLTRGWLETLVYPDTVLEMTNGVGVADYEHPYEFSLSQNYPNPFDGVTDFTLSCPSSELVAITIFDMSGKKIIDYQKKLPAGHHVFRVSLSAPQAYLASAETPANKASIKILNKSKGLANKVEYLGVNSGTNSNILKKGKGVTDRPFVFGDMMDYVGYATINGKDCESERVTRQQGSSQKYNLEFPNDIQPHLSTVRIDTIKNITAKSADIVATVVSNGYDSVIARGVCWSTSHNPTISDSLTSDGIGIGSYTSSLTGIVDGTTYYVRAYATNRVGTAYSEERSFKASLICGVDVLTDIEDNTYQTLQLGQQCWMKENLRTTKYADGTPINSSSWYYPNNNSSYKPTYGLLYTWAAVMNGTTSSSANPSGVQGICPAGWHVPSDAEWTQLTEYVAAQNDYICGGNTAYIAKALASSIGWVQQGNSDVPCWVANNQGGNNRTGFGALPAGYYNNNNGGYYNQCAYFWSTTEYDSSNAYYRSLNATKTTVSRSKEGKGWGFSVRCLRDN